MDTINEVRISTNVRLSQAQKFILTKLVLPDQREAPLTAYELISSGTNIVANRDTLVKLGMIELGENAARITDAGENALKQESLIDDTGNLTPQGEQYAYAKDLADIEKLADQQSQPSEPTQDQSVEPSGDGGQPVAAAAAHQAAGQGEVAPSFESWDMISKMQETISHRSFMDNNTKKL